MFIIPKTFSFLLDLKSKWVKEDETRKRGRLVVFELMGGNKTLELPKSIKIRICVIYIMLE